MPLDYPAISSGRGSRGESKGLLFRRLLKLLKKEIHVVIHILNWLNIL